MKKPTNKDLVNLYYEELWNKKNKDYIDILFDDNIIFYGSLGVECEGKKQFEAYMDTIHTGIPDLFHSITQWVVDDNSIAVRAIYAGRHSGNLLNFEATNSRLMYNGATFFKFYDGKIQSVWVLGDLHGLLEQLKNNSN